MGHVKKVLVRIVTIAVAYLIIVKILVATTYSAELGSADSARTNFEIVKTFKKKISQSIKDFVEKPTPPSSDHTGRSLNTTTGNGVDNQQGWQFLGKDKSIGVYSAHGFLNEKTVPKVTILAVFKEKSLNLTVRCKYSFKDTHQTTMAPGKLELSASLITCPLPVGSKFKSFPVAVSVLIDSQTWSSKKPMKIRYEKVPNIGQVSQTPAKNITVCAHSLDFEQELTLRNFVTWLTLLERFGVDQFLIFDNSTHEQLKCVIQQLGAVSSSKIITTPWRTEGNLKSEALKECIMRYKGNRSKWIIFSPVNLSIAPVDDHQTYQKLFSALQEQQGQQEIAGEFVFPSQSTKKSESGVVAIMPDAYNLYTSALHKEFKQVSIPAEVAQVVPILQWQPKSEQDLRLNFNQEVEKSLSVVH